MKRIHIPFLIVAVSLAITTSFLGLSAYLTDTDTYSQYLTTAAGDELGFSLSGDAVEETSILPGQTVPLNVKANIDNDVSLYLFIKMDIPSVFTLVDFRKDAWHPVEEGSNIYYYGTGSKLTSMGQKSGNGTTAPILGGVNLPTSVTGSNQYELMITGYAIQAEGIPANSSPADVFNMIGRDSDSSSSTGSDSSSDGSSSSEGSGEGSGNGGE